MTNEKFKQLQEDYKKAFPKTIEEECMEDLGEEIKRTADEFFNNKENNELPITEYPEVGQNKVTCTKELKKDIDPDNIIKW